LLLAFIGKEMVLDVHEFAILVDPFEGVTSVAVVTMPPIGSTVVRKEHQTGVITFRRVGEQVEGCIVVKQEVIRTARLRADNIGTLDWVTAEEYREVETNNIVVSFACIELNGEPARVSCSVWKLSAKSDGGEAYEDRSLYAWTAEKVRLG
jgi:hypothetical protein